MQFVSRGELEPRPRTARICRPGAVPGRLLTVTDERKGEREAEGRPVTLSGEVGKIHANLRIGNTVVMASDGFCKGQPEFQGFGLFLTLPDVAQVRRAFSALAEGGTIRMPLEKTFYSALFGMVADRFGVLWMLGVAP